MPKRIITIHYKPEDGEGFLIHSMEVIENPRFVVPASGTCEGISRGGFVIDKGDHHIWIPSHRIISVRLDRKEQDA